MSAHRLFIALRPPETIRLQLLAAMSGVEGARWQSDAQLHLTLRYIGEVERPIAEDIVHALARIRSAPVTVALDGVGSFDRKGIVHSLWAGIIPRAAAERLNQKVNAALAPLPIKPEEHGYLPHITLARGKPQNSLGNWCAANAGLSSAPFTMDWFGLYESHMTKNGSHYHLIHRFPLTETA